MNLIYFKLDKIRENKVILFELLAKSLSILIAPISLAVLPKIDFGEYQFALSISLILLPIITLNTASWGRHLELRGKKYLQKQSNAVVLFFLTVSIIGLIEKSGIIAIIFSTWAYRFCMYKFSACKNRSNYYIILLIFPLIQILILLFYFVLNLKCDYKIRVILYVISIITPLLWVLIKSGIEINFRYSTLKRYVKSSTIFGSGLMLNAITGMLVLNIDKVVIKFMGMNEFLAEYSAGFVFASIAAVITNGLMILNQKNIYKSRNETKNFHLSLKEKIILLITLTICFIMAAILYYYFFPINGYDKKTTWIFLTISIGYILMYKYNKVILYYTSNSDYGAVNFISILRLVSYLVVFSIFIISEPELIHFAFIISCLSMWFSIDYIDKFKKIVSLN